MRFEINIWNWTDYVCESFSSIYHQQTVSAWNEYSANTSRFNIHTTWKLLSVSTVNLIPLSVSSQTAHYKC